MTDDTSKKLWRVQGSFYVHAHTAIQAERAVSAAINSSVVQRLLGEEVGDIDVHAGQTEEWDLNA